MLCPLIQKIRRRFTVIIFVNIRIIFIEIKWILMARFSAIKNTAMLFYVPVPSQIFNVQPITILQFR